MLIVKCQERLDEVREFAMENGIEESLDKALEAVGKFGDKAELHHDFAPHSFTFLVRKEDGGVGFNGGVIYSGPAQALDGSGPAFTVGLGERPPGWSIHS